MERIIKYVNDVKDLSALLETARIDRVEFNGAGDTLTMALTRAMIEEPPAGRQGFFTNARIPWTASRLVLRRIRGVATTQAASGERPPLLECDAVPGGYELKIQGTGGMQHLVTVDQLDGEFSDVGSIVQVS